MSTKTKLEFNPAYFKSIFGDDQDEWQDFVSINISTYKKGVNDFRSAIEEKDMSTVKEVRHALGPTLQQWGAKTLEQRLIALEPETLESEWPSLEPEFEDLIGALESLK